MPILEIELVTEDGQVPTGLAPRLADAAGAVFEVEPGRVWVKLRGLAADHYAENATAPHETPSPVFVRVLLHTHPPADAWAATVTALSQAVAQCCGYAPQHVHILLEPEASGRIAFGGRLV